MITNLVFAILVAHSSFAAEWSACSQDSDCIKVPAGCARLGAVNKKFKDEFAKFVKEQDMVASCLAPSNVELAQDSAARPVCKKRKCELDVPPPPGN